MVQINKALNLVVELPRDGGNVVYVHSTPISSAVFDAHYVVIAKAFESIYSNGLARLSGARVAARLMRTIAKDLGVLDGPEGVENTLFNEIKRLTMVISPTTNGGWQQQTFPEATKAGVLDEEDVSEVENALAFFTVLFVMHRRAERQAIIESVINIWGGRIVSSNSTEFYNSLTISTQVAPTGDKPTAPTESTQAASSVPF